MFRCCAHALVCAILAGSVQASEIRETLPVYILAGQSNMVGNGANADLQGAAALPTECPIRVWGTTPQAWTTVRPGLGNNAHAFGPEVGFVHAAPERVAVLKVAISASDLTSQWRSPSRCPASRDEPGPAFSLLVEAVREGLADLAARGEAPKLAGFGWVQGESDAFHAESAAAYAANLLGFLQDVRDALDVPLLPTAVVRVPVSDAMAHASVVANAQDVVGRMLSSVRVIGIDDLETFDGLHYTSAGYLELGARIARALSIPDIARSGETARVVNVSARGIAGLDEQSLILGFVPRGDTIPLLVRGVGPSLLRYGLPAAANPSLRLFAEETCMHENGAWRFDPAVSWAGEKAGAEQLETAEDAALLRALPAGVYTARVDSTNAGVALMEVFDCGLDRADSARLGNASARAWVRAGSERLVLGFVVAGPADCPPVRLLIRAAGPALRDLGVAAGIPDPVVRVYRDETFLAANDDWDAALAPIADAVGAFAFAPESSDAALLFALTPGAYTVHVFDAGQQEGVVLAELYQLDEPGT